MNIDIFSHRTLSELTIFLFWILEMIMAVLKDLKLEDITYQKVLLRIILSSLMEKTFITNQFILTLKQYKEITKLTTGHGKDYTTRC